MRKKILFAAAALAALSCATVEFDNPLDPNGTNYLWNYDVSEEEESEMISDGPTGGARLWTDANFACDRRPPVVTVLGDNPARIRYGDTADIKRFKGYMGLLDDYWFGAAEVERGIRNTVVTVDITLSEDRLGTVKHEPDWETPEPGTYYILYVAEKPPCGEGVGAVIPRSVPAVREIIVEPPIS